MTDTNIEANPTPTPLPAVKVGGPARKMLTDLMRKWSGWSDSKVLIENIEGTVASTDHIDHTFRIDIDRTLLNPNRVLRNVTPFRLRQEAVTTGALLHEASHARHTHWKPRTPEQVAAFKYMDGTPVSKAVFDLASLCEEPRIEGLMAAEAAKVGAAGLEWTMRASAAHLLPLTQISDDPAQALMDIMKSWILRAGRQVALSTALPAYTPASWTSHFTSLLHDALVAHFADMAADAENLEENYSPESDAKVILDLLRFAIRGDGNMDTQRGNTFDMIETARVIMKRLFPETPEDQMPSPSTGGGCAEVGEEGVAAPQSGEQDADGEEDGEGAGGPGEGKSEALAAALAAMEAGLNAAEQGADAHSEAESKTEAEQAPAPGGLTGGTGGASKFGWREPDASDREVASDASRFLRDLINPTETSTTALSESPSSTIDGAAMSAWKAGGQMRDPRFFKRTRRDVEPAPPVQIAILVDISSSMSVLQKPSALLSWALSSAAFDLRNFAGRGVQVQSTLIHWGVNVHVVAKPGEMLKGIRTVACNEGTSAMGQALAEVENQLPGFFDASAKPENRLLVQFTDWELFGPTAISQSREFIGRGLEAGVNMLSVVPSSFGYSGQRSLTRVLNTGRPQRGRSTIMVYRNNPSLVWAEAKAALR